MMDWISFLPGLAVGAAGATALLRQQSRPELGLPEKLNWGHLVDERGQEGEHRQAAIEQKDTALVAGWRCRGPDLDADTAAALKLLTHQVNHAFLPFVDHWMFHADAVQVESTAYAPPGAFRDATTATIDAERREAYQSSGKNFETELYLTATYRHPHDVYSRLGNAFVSRPRHDPDFYLSLILDQFWHSLGKLESAMPTSIQLERLDADALLTHLHFCLTGKRHPISAPEDGCDLSELLVGEEECWPGYEPVIGAKHVRVVEFTKYPLKARPGMLDELTSLGLPFRFSTRFIPLSEAQALKQIRWQTKGFANRRRSLGKQVMEAQKKGGEQDSEDFYEDQYAVQMARDSKEAAALASSGTVRYCWYTPAVVVMQADPQYADFIASEIARVLNRKGFSCTFGTGLNAQEAFMGTLPGHGYYNVRKPLVHTRNIAKLLPLTSKWPGLRTNPCRYFPPESPPVLWGKTEGSVPVRINFHVSPPDVGHHLIIAPTGAGKSFLLNLLAAQWLRYPNAKVRHFDNGYSGYALCKAARGTHYDLCSGRVDSVCLQPLRRLETPAYRAKAERWLAVLFDVHGIRLTPDLQTTVAAALQLLARMEPAERTLTQLYYQIQNDALRAALGYYCADIGNFGQLLDAPYDDVGVGDYQAFELRHLLAFRDDRITVPVLAYLFGAIERGFDGSPIYIPVDEGKMAMKEGLFAEQMATWSISVRKDNVVLGLATQDPADLANSPYRSQLMESYPVHFFLPNSKMTGDGMEQYRNMGLNEREIEIIRTAQPQRHTYYKTPLGSRLFELAPGPVARTFLGGAVGKSSQELREDIDRLITLHGRDWPGEWLRIRGLSQWAEEWDRRSSPLADGERHQTEDNHEDIVSALAPPLGAAGHPGAGNGRGALHGLGAVGRI